MVRGHLLCIPGQARDAVELLTQSLKAVKVWMGQVGAEFQLLTSSVTISPGYTPSQ